MAGSPTPRERLHLPGWAVAGAWVLVATTLQLVRAPDKAPWRALWAEDGRVFLDQAFAHPLSSLFRSHSGYLQFTARTVAAVAAVVPVSDAAIAFAVVGSLAVSIVSVYVYVSSRSILSSTWARGLLAASVAFASVTAFEVDANGLDLHWYLLFACFLALWSTDESNRMLVADSVVVALATLSGPLSVFLAPLALHRLVRGKGWRRWLVPGVFGVCVVAQAVTAKLYPAGVTRFSAFEPKDLPVAYGLRVAGSVLVGDRYLPSAWITFGKYFVALSVVVVGGVCLYGLVRARGQKFVFIAVALAYSGLLFVVSLSVRGSGEMRPPGDLFVYNGSRYTVVPVLLLIAVLVVIADNPATSSYAWVRWALAGFVALVSVLSFHSVPTVRGRAPYWRADVGQARQVCAETGATKVRIPIAPGPPEAWYVDIPCDRIVGIGTLREWPAGSPPRGS